MVLYIWLLYHQILIQCTQAGCIQSSMANFDYLSGIGAVELIFELAGIIKIYQKVNKKKE